MFIAPQSKLFEHLDKLAALRETRQTPAPINIECDLTNRCNLGCEWCAFGYTHSKGPLKGKRAKPADAVPGGDVMDTSLALKLVRQASEMGVRSIVWTGGGEPTSHRDFDDIADYTHGKLEQGIYTNGTLIKQERAELMKRCFTFVYVSLDAADSESYRAAKRVNKFEAACDGIRRLADSDGDATIGVGFLVTPTNYQDVFRAAELAESLGADYVQFRPVIRYEQDAPGKVAEDTGWLDDALPMLEQLSEQPGVEIDLDRFHLYREWAGHGYSTCWWSALQTVITPNGKLWACVNKREHPTAEIGDLSVESLLEIWARHTACGVSADCRAMCRGHLANVALAEIMAVHPHPAFV